MKLIFDAAIDGGAWPGPFVGKNYVFGESWVGPQGLLDILETRLGLRGRYDDSLRRVCRLARSLQSLDGFWRSSFETDPLATGRRLLRDRDQLREWGWTGQPASSRLAELNAATKEASPGTPDRLEAVVGGLAGRSTGIDSIVSFTDLKCLSPLWRRVFEALRRSGVRVTEATAPHAPAQGDLAGIFSERYRPVGDGRLSLLRRYGPLDLADEVAGALAASDALDRIVIIGADAVLDAALARHGLPRVGAHSGSTSSSQLLLLVIKTAFRPTDISDVHALLAAEPGPIPKGIAARLIDAIREFPGRASSAWDEAITEGLARLDEDKRPEAASRIRDLVLPDCDRGLPLPVTDLRRRLKSLDDWARSRTPFVPSLLDLRDRIQTLLEAVEIGGETALSWERLRGLCEDLGESGWKWTPAQAGLAHVNRPGAVLGPARAIVWWNFSRSSVRAPERVLLSRADREGLRAAGVEPPDPSFAVTIETAGWRRALFMAQEAVLLACPFMDESGERNHPHPLWDDISASIQDPQDLPKLERSEVLHPAPSQRAAVSSRPLVVPVPEVVLLAPVALRDTESPSSIEQLIGCSMSWALKYRGHLRSGLSDGPPEPNPLLYGKLADQILSQVLARAWADPDEAAAEAARLFNASCDDLCESLALPQYQSSRATVRRAVVESARYLAGLALKHAASGIRTQVDGTTRLADLPVAGRSDLVWERPAVLLDLKWGKSAYVEKMQSGTAIQLGAYAAMHEVRGAFPETGYFAINSQDLLAEPGGLLAGDARMHGEHRAADVWAGVALAVQRRRTELAAGRLVAPGASDVEVEAGLTADGVRIPAPCRYCEYGALCGQRGTR